MITGTLREKIDKVWDTFWSGGLLELLINSYISNGIVDKDMFYESPFTDDGKGLDHFSDTDRKDLLQLVEKVNAIKVA